MTAAAAAVGVVVVHGERTLTDLDYSRLTKLVNRQVPPVLDDLLANAEVTSSRTVQADPDGQVKFPHPWPPQIPPGRTTRL